VKLGLMNEILGRSRFAPTVFGCQAPDTGNAEILARFGTPEQKRRYLEPLLAGEIASCYSMTEPQAGADPASSPAARTRGRRVGHQRREVVRLARGFLALPAGRGGDRPDRADPPGRVDPDRGPRHARARGRAQRRRGPAREIGKGVHGHLRFTNCRVPAENILGKPGQGFEVAQSRLGGGRIHHAMRTVGVMKRALDMMCERALSRTTKGELLSAKQLTQEKIADSYTQITQFRLHVLYAAWLIDKHQAYTREVRREIAAVKAAMPGVLRDVVYRALHLHGSLGMSNDTPLMADVVVRAGDGHRGRADRGAQVHGGEGTAARPGRGDGAVPDYYYPNAIEKARAKLAHGLELEVGNL
jgi:acyl-CoA dehydrogenase